MWMKVDDGLHTHRKTRTVTKSHGDKRRDSAPMGLWVLAGSWAAQNGTDGWVPEDELDRWDDDWPNLAKRLCKAGYWWPSDRNSEPGFGFTDWHDYNDPAGAASKAGTFGNHVRWHANAGKVEPECDHCPKEPDEDPPIAPRSPPDSGGISPPDTGAIAHPIALPEPEPLPNPNPAPSTAIAVRDDDEDSAQTFIGEWIEHCDQRPPGRVIGHVAREVKAMLTEGIDPTRVRNGLAEWHRRGLHPSTLPSVVHELSTPQQRRGQTRNQETEDLFSRAAVRMGVIQGGQS